MCCGVGVWLLVIWFALICGACCCCCLCCCVVLSVVVFVGLCVDVLFVLVCCVR